MAVEFKPENLSCRTAASRDGIYRMFEVDGYWTALYEGKSARLLGTSLQEIDAMKLIDMHIRREAEKCQCNGNCGGKCHDAD